MTAQQLLLVLLGVLASACRASSHPFVDLEGPILLGSDLSPGEERGPSDPIRLWFSESLDPGAIGEHAVVLVPFELGDPCPNQVGCEEGWRCHRGRCQRDPISSGWLSDLASPPLGAARLAKTVSLIRQLDSTATELSLYPRWPLAPHRLHALLVGRVRDLQGNPVQLPGPGSVVALQEVLATAAADQARPSLSLRSPPAGAVGVPPNLDRILLRASRPVRGLGPGSVWLELPSGARIDLLPRAGSALCRSSAERTCHELALAGVLPPLSRVELRASATITDDQMRPLHESELPGPSPSAFSTAAAPDLTPPRLEALEVLVADRCLVVRARSDEVCDLELRADWLGAEAAGAGANRHELGVAAPLLELGQFDLQLSDLAGNRTLVLPQTVDGRAPPPWIVISEVLANPAGPEPAQEFVELVNLGTGEIDLAGFRLDDGDDGIGIDLLPSALLRPGEVAVVVGAKYHLEGHADPPPVAGSVLVRLSGTLGDGGLANVGERIALRDPSGRLVSSYGAHYSTSGSKSSGQSVERIDLGGCDLAENWRPRPDGRSSPGEAAAGADSRPGPLQWGW